jgi:multiple sugar transport system permease protein
LAFSSLGGYALARLRFRGAEGMTTVLLITYLPPGALMFIPLYKILTELRLINSLQGLIFTYPTFMLPFATWLLMGYYRSIPEGSEHAAMVDGATLIIFLPVVVLYSCGQRFMIAGLTAGSVKG